MSLRSRVCIVTGGAQGIGQAVCTAILNRMGKVSILDVNEQKGKQSVVKIEKEFGPGRALFFQCDASSKTQMEGAFQKTVDKFGHIDVVINNAGIEAASQELAEMEKMIDINVKGVVIGTYLGKKYMGTSGGKGKGGVIVNVASMAGLLPSALNPVYTATKHAVVGLSRSLKMLKLQEGIRVNCICPSLTDTPLVRSARLRQRPDIPQQERDEAEQIELLRPELVAEGITQLIEDETKHCAVMRVTQAKGIDFKVYRHTKM